jgi:hypothetical protein
MVLALLSTRSFAQTAPATEIRINSLTPEVTITDDAYVEWNFLVSEKVPGERAKIKQIFMDAIQETGAELDGGDGDFVLKVEITHFDILSSVEILFCCAMNEVSARYELRDARTSAVVKPWEELNFDHFGRGGIVAFLSAAGGEDQLGHLRAVIRKGTLDWLAETR